MTESEQPAEGEESRPIEEEDGMMGGFAEEPQGGEGGEEPSSQDPSTFTNYPEGNTGADAPGSESPGEAESEGGSE